MEKRTIFRIGLLFLLLFLFYSQGVSFGVLLAMLVVFLPLVLFRERVWKGVERVLCERLSFYGSLPGWGKWIAIFIVFLIVYYIVKLAVYSLLGAVGIDIQGEIEKIADQMGQNQGI